MPQVNLKNLRRRKTVASTESELGSENEQLVVQFGANCANLVLLRINFQLYEIDLYTF